MNRELRTPIEFFQYDKITDDLFFLDKNTVIRFVVSLSRQNGEDRKPFHSEFEYPSRKGNYKSLITLRRSYDYYLTLENLTRDKDGFKEYIIISMYDFILFRNGLEVVIDWFTSADYKHLFAMKQGKLILTAPIPSCKVGPLGGNKFIKFIPCILGNETAEPGVEIELNSETNVARMNVRHFMGLYYLMSNFNMLNCAQNMLNYIGRPEFGSNLFSYGTTTDKAIANRLDEPINKTEVRSGYRKRTGLTKTINDL